MMDKPKDDDHLGQLLRLAGPREAVPPERMMRVRAAARDEWRRHTRARARRVMIGWAIGGLGRRRRCCSLACAWQFATPLRRRPSRLRRWRR